MNSNVFIVGPGKPKDHRGISNTVDSTRAFGVAGRTASDVSYISFFFFFSLLCETGIEKISYKSC